MKTDFLVIGSGIAGLVSALTLAEYADVILVSKGNLISGSSSIAQGGIAAVISEKDSFGSHIRDTITAGAGHSDLKAVRFLVEHGLGAIRWLETQGVSFDSNNGNYLLGREAAHSLNRILHITDFTGPAVVRRLVERVRENPRINCLENTFFLDLLIEKRRCYGGLLLQDKNIFNCFSRATILATGGLGQIYLRTTNPSSSTGDGIAAALRGGAEIKDMEFIQFHPTALEPVSFSNSSSKSVLQSENDSSPLFLLSEAIRGEGGYIVNEKGERFVGKYDSRAELAPRDIIARVIYLEKKHGKVFLDIRHKNKKFLLERFPNIYSYLLDLGFDMAEDLLPVTPAAHFSCGGVATDIYGRTNIDSLFAFGEVACSGVHGANRLASNSLLEAIVFPRQLKKVVGDIDKTTDRKGLGLSGFEVNKQVRGSDSTTEYSTIRKALRKLMWEKVGVVRKKDEMSEALSHLTKWKKKLVRETEINFELAELKNMVTVARLVTDGALKRRESIGAHFVID